MKVRAGGEPTPGPARFDCPLDTLRLNGGVFFYIPIAGIDGFGSTEIKRELRNNLPFKTEISSAAKTIHRRNGKSIEHIVLVAVNTVVPITGIEGLQAEVEGYWPFAICHLKIIGKGLKNRDTVGDG